MLCYNQFQGAFMKKALFILLLAFLSISIFAAPFGLKKGMSINEIAAVCDGTAPKYAGNNCYYISPAKKHPLFQTYIAFVDSEKGLYRREAVTSRQMTMELKLRMHLQK